MTVQLQPLEIKGIAIAQLVPIERKKIASGLDYIGFVPGLGSVGGVARLIGAISVMIFCSIKAAHAKDAEKENLLMWRTVAAHEALRGLCEITWIFNVLPASFACCVADIRSLPGTRSGSLSDEEYLTNQTRYKPIQSVISSDSCFAHGNYIYKDNSPRSGAIHYSYKKYDGNQVIWRTLTSHGGEMVSNYSRTDGIVLKKGYKAEPHLTQPATYIVKETEA